MKFRAGWVADVLARGGLVKFWARVGGGIFGPQRGGEVGGRIFVSPYCRGRAGWRRQFVTTKSALGRIFVFHLLGEGFRRVDFVGGGI